MMAARGWIGIVLHKFTRAQDPIPAFDAPIVFGVEENEPDGNCLFGQGTRQFQQHRDAGGAVICAGDRIGVLRGIGIIICEHARIVMRAEDDLRRLVTSLGNDVFDGMSQRFGFLDFDLPARFDELLARSIPGPGHVPPTRARAARTRPASARLRRRADRRT